MGNYMKRRRRSTNIDITPLMDLTFMLLIIFIITVPAMEYSTDVTPPSMDTPKTVESITDKPVFLNLRSDNFDLCPRHINHTTLILSDTGFYLLGFIKPTQRSAPGKLRPRIALFLLGKHKFQVYLVVGIVVN